MESLLGAIHMRGRMGFFEELKQLGRQSLEFSAVSERIVDFGAWGEFKKR